MKAVVLAAGYATRMYPLTRDTPKALLPVGGPTLIDHLLARTRETGRIDEVVVVTNHRFAAQFESWRAGLAGVESVRILDDGTSTNEGRRGAVGDIGLALESMGTETELVVMAGDNLVEFPLGRFLDFFERCATDCITIRVEGDVAKLRRTGVVEVDPAWRVIGFEEKPAEPRSSYACPPLYAFLPATLGLVAEYLRLGNNADAPGHFIAWLCRRRRVHAHLFDEPCHDLGDLDSYRRIDALFRRRASAAGERDEGL